MSDVIMLEMNGFELTEKIRNKYPDTRIIIVSGYNDRLNKIDDSCKFVDESLGKPVGTTPLPDEIKTLLTS